MKRVSLACLFFLFRPGTWLWGLLGAGTFCFKAMGDFSHAPKPCPCLQTAKVPMLAGIWGSLPNLKPGRSAELATSFLLGVRLRLVDSEGGTLSCPRTPGGRHPPCSQGDQSLEACVVFLTRPWSGRLGWAGVSTHSTVAMAKIVATFPSLLPGVGASVGDIPPLQESRAHLRGPSEGTHAHRGGGRGTGPAPRLWTPGCFKKI